MKEILMKINHKNKAFLLILMLSSFLPITNLKVQAQHNHDSNNHPEKTEHNHTHKTLDISNKSNIPTLKINVSPDKMEGWNLEIKTTNFSFNPESINQNSNPNQGHAHLYINGKKITRIYGNWYYISELPKGKNEITVTLNTNLHEDLMVNGNIISDRVMIDNK